MTDTVRRCWKDWDLAVEDGQQRGSQAGGDRTRYRRGDVGRNGEDKALELGSEAELRESGQVGRAIRREGGMPEDGEPDTRKLETSQEIMQILEESGESYVDDAAMETFDGITVDAHMDCDWQQGREEVGERERGDDLRRSGQTVVENTNTACVERGRSRELRGHHRRS